MAAYLLVAFGFGWMVVAAFLGLYLGSQQENYFDELQAAASKGDLLKYHQLSDVYKWRTTVHAHGMLFSLTSVAIGLVLLQNTHAVPMPGVLAGTLASAVVVWTLAALKRIRLLMGLSDLIFVVVIATVAVCTVLNS